MKDVKNYSSIKTCSSINFFPSSVLAVYIRYSHYNQDERYIEIQTEALDHLMYEHGEVKL